MNVERIEFNPAAGPHAASKGYQLEVVVHGEGFRPQARPFVIEVGNQRVRGVLPGLDETTLRGHLTDEPQDGDEVKVGLADSPLQRTGITYQRGGVA